LTLADELDRIVSSLLLIKINDGGIERLARLLFHMKTFEQRKYMNAVVSFVAKQYFSTEVIKKDDSSITSSTIVDAVAGLVHVLIKDNDVLKEHLILSLTRSTMPVLDDSLSARRSVVAALAQDYGKKRYALLSEPSLIRPRQVAHPFGKFDQAIWRFGLYQAYSGVATRRYVAFGSAGNISNIKQLLLRL
jgi:hypothetical protein